MRLDYLLLGSFSCNLVQMLSFPPQLFFVGLRDVASPQAAILRMWTVKERVGFISLPRSLISQTFCVRPAEATDV